MPTYDGRLAEQFGTLAAQYYVWARFAALAGYAPVCGNLMHHVMEMLLKAGAIKRGLIPHRADVGEHQKADIVGAHLKKKYRHRLGERHDDDSHCRT
jgi:hypothetical protein